VARDEKLVLKIPGRGFVPIYKERPNVPSKRSQGLHQEPEIQEVMRRWWQLLVGNESGLEKEVCIYYHPKPTNHKSTLTPTINLL